LTDGALSVKFSNVLPKTTNKQKSKKSCSLRFFYLLENEFYCISKNSRLMSAPEKKLFFGTTSSADFCFLFARVLQKRFRLGTGKRMFSQKHSRKKNKFKFTEVCRRN